MLVASVGILEISLAFAILGITLAALWSAVLVHRKQFQRLPSVIASAMVIVLAAIAASWWAGMSPPREVRPLTSDLVILIDTSRSMAETDEYRDATRETVDDLAALLRERLESAWSETTRLVELDPNEKARQARLDYWRKQREQLAANVWKPNRLQIAQALLTRAEPNWLKEMLHEHQARVHLYHLDDQGRPVKLRDPNGEAGELLHPEHESGFQRAASAILRLQPRADQSPLGAAIRQLVDLHRDSPLLRLLVFTDGSCTGEESLTKAAEYAADKNCALFFVGLGEMPRDLLLHDLNVEPTAKAGAPISIGVRLTGHGLTDATVPVLLKRKTHDGAEKEIQRKMVKIDPGGRSVAIQFVDTPADIGLSTYIVEAVPPRLDLRDRPIPPAHLRMQRRIDVADAKPIKVLYVEGQPRFEFRFIKNLLEAERLRAKPALELNVLLLDAEDEWGQPPKIAVGDHEKPREDPMQQQRRPTVLRSFPEKLAELNAFDVLILGDCDPAHRKWKAGLPNIVRFAHGSDENRKPMRRGGGVLFMAGPFHNPHRYAGTPLAQIVPVVPFPIRRHTDQPITDSFRPVLTEAGREHPIFRFRLDEAENPKVWQNLQPLFWHATGYKAAPLAETLAVHPGVRGAVQLPGGAARHPLILQMPAGSGRTLFFGIEETWRWRYRDGQPKFDEFWRRTLDYLALRPHRRTELVLDKRTAYRQGDEIKVTVSLADEVRVAAGSRPVIARATFLPLERKDPEFITIPLQDVAGALRRGTIKNAQPGHYRIRLTEPDVVVLKLGREIPTATADVVALPKEAERAPMNVSELAHAADVANGAFFAVTSADEFLRHWPRQKKTP